MSVFADWPDGDQPVTFVHRFASALSAKLHFHCGVIGGLGVFRAALGEDGFAPRS